MQLLFAFFQDWDNICQSTRQSQTNACTPWCERKAKYNIYYSYYQAFIIHMWSTKSKRVVCLTILAKYILFKVGLTVAKRLSKSATYLYKP